MVLRTHLTAAVRSTAQAPHWPQALQAGGTSGGRKAKSRPRGGRSRGPGSSWGTDHLVGKAEMCQPVGGNRHSLQEAGSLLTCQRQPGFGRTFPGRGDLEPQTASLRAGHSPRQGAWRRPVTVQPPMSPCSPSPVPSPHLPTGPPGLHLPPSSCFPNPAPSESQEAPPRPPASPEPGAHWHGGCYSQAEGSLGAAAPHPWLSPGVSEWLWTAGLPSWRASRGQRGRRSRSEGQRQAQTQAPRGVGSRAWVQVHSAWH